MTTTGPDPLPDSAAARLLALAVGQDPQWPREELGAMLAHQWSAELAVDLCGLPGVEAELVRALGQAATPAIRTFGELLWHTSPPAKLLNWVKEFAKRAADHPARPLPRDLAKVIYSVTLLVARRCGCSISGQDEVALARGAAWVLSQPWVDERTRDLVRRCLQ